VSPDHALSLITGIIGITMMLVGPVLAGALIAGVFVGIVQTATQINEPSVGYVVKAGAVALVLLAAGPTLASKIVSYTRDSIGSIATVVK
jgi:flagellar biosynthetic protein FliQ